VYVSLTAGIACQMMSKRRNPPPVSSTGTGNRARTALTSADKRWQARNEPRHPHKGPTWSAEDHHPSIQVSKHLMKCPKNHGIPIYSQNLSIPIRFLFSFPDLLMRF
jgi:hypothetical protein